MSGIRDTHHAHSSRRVGKFPMGDGMLELRLWLSRFEARMRWSWTVGRVAGIELRMHATFLLLLAWVAFVYYQAAGVHSALFGLAFTVALFLSIVLHELGHASIARRRGVVTHDILLLPIGGVARLESIPEKPSSELAIATAGPLVTLTIIALLAGFLWLIGVPLTMTEADFTHYTPNTFLIQLLWVNVSLLFFNLLPAFPMDGGRVLRAILARHRDYLRATDQSAKLGRVFAVLFGLIGLLYSPMLLLVAVFVWVGATAESFGAHERVALRDVAVARLMVRAPVTLQPDDSLRSALEHIITGFQHDFPVVDRGRVIGVLTRGGLLEGLARRGELSLVSSSMDANFRTARQDEPVSDVLTRLRTSACHAAVVLEDDQLLGILTKESVADFVLFESARHQAHAIAPSRAPQSPRARPATL